MYKQTITYTDFSGNERTEDFYFNLSKAELMKMELMTKGTFTDMLQRIINAKDTPDIIREINELLLTSYGVKSDDGRYFRKSPEIRADFENSEPFSVMFMKLLSNDEEAATFINGIMPEDVAKSAAVDIEALRKQVQETGNLTILPPAN